MARRDAGSILITTLIFMFVLSFMLMAYLDMSTTALKQTTYAEQTKKAFYLADGSVTYAGKMIDTLLTSYDCTRFSTDFSAVSLQGGLTCDQFISNLRLGVSTSGREAVVTFGEGSAQLDVQKVGSAEFSGISSGEFASGYEGIGGGAASGGVFLFFGIDSIGKSTLGAKSNIYGVYRKVPGMSGGV